MHTGALGPVPEHVGLGRAIVQAHTSVGDVVLDQAMRQALIHALPEGISRINYRIPSVGASPDTVASRGVDILVRVGWAVGYASLVMEVSIEA